MTDEANTDVMMAIVEEWLAIVRSKAQGRTRYERQEPFQDEAVLAHIESLRTQLAEAIKVSSEEARKRGEAEGKLRASEAAGVVDGWIRRAEAADAKVTNFCRIAEESASRATAAEAARDVAEAKLTEADKIYHALSALFDEIAAERDELANSLLAAEMFIENHRGGLRAANLKGRAKQIKAVVDAAEEWWTRKRPIDWDEAAHLKNPDVNCVSTAEGDLAQAVRALQQKEPSDG